MADPHTIPYQRHVAALRGGLADAARALQHAARRDETGQWADAILAIAACGALLQADDEGAEAFRRRLAAIRLHALLALRKAAAEADGAP